jgi:hypothetical protein
MRVVMTLFVRDEADIIGELVRYHLDQGVHAFAVIDNGSTDGTTEILRRRDLAEHVHLTYEPQNVSQEDSVTGLARFAATELGADWVIASDGDEFWTPTHDTIPETLARVDAGKVHAHWWHFPPRAGHSTWKDRMNVRLLAARPPWFHTGFKVAFRADPSAVVSGGNHDATVEHPGSTTGLIDVLHFPFRSLEQFERKMVRAYELRPAHGNLEERYEIAYRNPKRADRRLVVSDFRLRRGLRQGIYANDERVRDAL